MRGPAGTEKSIISKTVAQVFADRGQLAASFFFNKTREGRNTAKLFVTTVARQIAGRVPTLKNLILRAINENQDLPDKSLEAQFSKLILEPLRRVQLSGVTFPTLILVVDALDECGFEHRSQVDESLENSRLIIKILSRLATTCNINARIFLTSRPEVPIRLGFLEDVPTGSHQDVALHEIPEPVIKHNIRAFTESELEAVRVSHAIAQDWPGDDVVTQLVKASVPLFIYASTICKFIDDRRRKFRPQAQLNKVLRQSEGFQTDIEITYRPILDQLVEDLDDLERKELLARFRKIVGAIILLADPLSIVSLGELLDIENDEIRYLLNSLHSVLDVPEDDQPEHSVRLFHLSFREFLLPPHSSGDQTFWIDEKSTHKDLFACCLQVMGDQSGFGLRNDLCRLHEPGVRRYDIPRERIYQHVPRSLEYACRYWVMHLRESGGGIHVRDAHEFLTRCLLYWLEAMSWMNLLHQAARDLLTLEDMFSSQGSSMQSEALPFLRDARRFLAENEHVINMAPYQVYVSALIFAPKASLVKQRFRCEIPGCIVKMPEVAEDWDMTSRTIHQYKLPVQNVVWSHDGQYIAVATFVEVDIWNVNSGVLLKRNTDMRHINCITFTNCGMLIIGSSFDRILLWDWVAGLETTFSIGNGFSEVLTVSAATTGKVLCLLSDGNVCLMSETFDIIHTWYTCWQPSAGDTKRTRSKLHPHYLGRVHFTRNGKIMAVIDNAQSNSIHVHDAESGALIQSLSAPEGQMFYEVTASDEGLLIATVGSVSPLGERPDWYDVIMEAFKVTLWYIGSENEEMGSEVAILDTPWEVQTKVDDEFATAWSSNGAFLAVASSAGFVVYDCSAHHPAILKSVSYKYEASSLDNTLRQLLFSPCGSSIAITHGDIKSVSLWNFPSCPCRWLQALQDPNDCKSAMTIKFSPDGAQLAVSHGYNARLMDSNTGAIIWTRSFASLNVRFIDSLAFSSSGALMAIKAFQIDRKPSSIESGSGLSVNSEQKSFDKSPVNIEEMTEYGSVKRLFVTNVANGRHIATMSLRCGQITRRLKVV